MTLLPAANRDVKGIEYGPKYPKYKVGPLCQIPNCSRLGDHAHHMWRRSFLTGDYGWVKLWDGTVVQNLMSICWRHHDEVTKNEAKIIYSDIGMFFWQAEGDTPYALDPQPKRWDHCEDLGRNKLRPQRDEHVHDGPGSGDKCPTCKRRVPKEKSETVEAKRPRKDWKITVPVDERENGAQVLDTLLEECAKIFGHDETKALKYFTLAQALALVVQDYA